MKAEEIEKIIEDYEEIVCSCKYPREKMGVLSDNIEKIANDIETMLKEQAKERYEKAEFAWRDRDLEKNIDYNFIINLIKTASGHKGE